MLLISFPPYSIRQHPHETEHAIIDKMRKDSADHQIRSWIGETHDFDTVAWLQARIQPPVYSVIGIVDQRRPRWLSYRNSQGCIDVLRLSPIGVNINLVEPGDNEVDRATRLNCGNPWYQFMMIGCCRRVIREPVKRRHPLAETDGSVA